jgi:predicted Zn finger-like uncharacterized protein
MIDFSCPKCRARSQVSSAAAGRRIKCPECGETITLVAQRREPVLEVLPVPPLPPHARPPDDQGPAWYQMWQVQVGLAVLGLMLVATLTVLGVIFSDGGDVLPRSAEGRVTALSRRIDKNPHDARAYESRARAYIDTEEYSLAVADCTKAIEIDPGSADAYFARAEANSRRGIDHKREIVPDLTAGLALRPGNFDALSTRAIYQEDPNLSAADIAEAIAANPDRADAFAYYKRAHYLLLAKRAPEAIVDATKAVELAPRKQWAHARLGEALWHAGDFNGALAELERADELSRVEGLSAYYLYLYREQLKRREPCHSDDLPHYP